MHVCDEIEHSVIVGILIRETQKKNKITTTTQQRQRNNNNNTKKSAKMSTQRNKNIENM